MEKSLYSLISLFSCVITDIGGGVAAGSLAGSLLNEHLVSLMDSATEVLPVCEVALDLLDGQVDQHTSDLGRELLADLAEHEVENGSTNLVLVVRVDNVDGLVDRHHAAVELTGLRVVRALELNLGLAVGHRHASGLGHRGLGRYGWRALLLTHVVSAILVIVVALTAIVLAALMLSTLSVHASLAHVVGLMALAMGAHLSHAGTLTLHTTLVALHGVHEDAQNRGDLLVGLVVKVLEVLSLVALEVLLVLGGLVLDLALLLHLVVRNVEGSVVELELGALDSRSLVGSLEAHEGVGVLAITSFEEAQRFDLAVGAEQVLQVVFRGVRVEVFHEEVAALLGSLVFEGLVGKDLIAVIALEGLLHVELLVAEGLSVHLCASFCRAGGTVLAVHRIVVAVADKSVCTVIVAVDAERLDVAIGAEMLPNFRFTPGVRDVFDVNVVECLAEVTLVFGRKFDTNDVFAVGGLGKCALHVTGVLETDEAIVATGVVLVHGDLAGLDLAVFRELLLEVLMENILRDFAYKNVLVHKAGDV